MPRIAQRQDRISLRLSSQSKRKLERAAAYADKTVTDFVLDSALKTAEDIVREQELITLTPAEFQRFADALLNPPPPNKALRKAFRDHRRLVRE